MSDNASTPSASQQLFCCPSVPVVRKSNISPNHPLHQLLVHLSTQQNGDGDNDDAPASSELNQSKSSKTPASTETIPTAGECAIIIISDPVILQNPMSPPSLGIEFDPSRATSRMYWGKLSNPNSPSNLNDVWTWREEIDARDNVGGILREVDGNQDGRLRKEMTGYDCGSHRWKFTFVVLIGVGPQERLAAMMAAAAAADGARDGARDGAGEEPTCNPQ